MFYSPNCGIYRAPANKELHSKNATEIGTLPSYY